MKINITNDDYNDILTAIVVAGASAGSEVRFGYQSLYERIVNAWESAKEEEILIKITGIKAE